MFVQNMPSYNNHGYIIKRRTQNMPNLLLLWMICVVNVQVNSLEQSINSCLVDTNQSKSSSSDEIVANSISSADLKCSAKCNTVKCVFEYDTDRISFSFLLNETSSNPRDVRIEAVPEGNAADVIFVPQHLMHFKRGQSNESKSGQLENSNNEKSVKFKTSQSEGSEDENGKSTSEKRLSMPWNVLYTIHEDEKDTYLLVSVGKMAPSRFNDCLIFRYVSAYRRKVGTTMTYGTCSVHQKYDVPNDKTVKNFGPSCSAAQLSMNMPKYDVAVLVDQRDACKNDSIFGMVYRLDSDVGDVITKASIYLLNFNLVRDGRAVMELQTDLPDDPNRFFDPADVRRSFVELSISENGENLNIILKTTAGPGYIGPNPVYIIVSIMPLVDCESHLVDDLWDDESKDIDIEDTKNHAVCHSFNHGLRASSLRRQSVAAALRKMSSSKDRGLQRFDVDINCIATECTKAMCTIEVSDRTLIHSQFAESSLKKNYVLVVEFEIPLCHMHAIFYKVYEMKKKKRMYVTDGTIGVSSSRSDYRKDTEGAETYFINGAVYRHDDPADSPGLMHNLYFDARYLCGPLLNESNVESEDRSEVYTEFLLQRRCLHFQSASYPLIMLATRESICDVSTSISGNQCQDLRSSLKEPSSSPGSGDFYLNIYSEKPQTHVIFDCDVTENCDGINCLYSMYSPLAHDANSFHDGGTLGERLISQTVVQYRNEHCSQFSKGLVTTSESYYHTNKKYLSGDETLDSNPQFDFRSAYKPTTDDPNDDPSLDERGKLPILFIPGLKTESSEVALTMMSVEPTLKPVIPNSLLSIKLISDWFLYNQASDITLGAAHCESDHFTISRTCKEWKDAAAKFRLPNRNFACSSDFSCTGMSCKEHSSGESYHLSFGLCLGFHVFVKKEPSTSSTAKGGGLEEETSVYTKGSKIPQLGNAFLHDYVMYRDCVVLILTASEHSSHTLESVIPRSCPNVPGSMEERLQNCSTGVKKVLLDEKFQMNDVKDFVYAPQNETQEPRIEALDLSGSSNWKPLLLGFVFTTTSIILMTSLSIMLCKKRGYMLERPNTRFSRRFRFDFSRSMRNRAFTDSSAVLYRDDEDDISMASGRSHPNHQEMKISE